MWWCGAELIMLQMLPTYTFERLQDTDIDYLLPCYFYYCRVKSGKTSPQENVVCRDGKQYKKVSGKNASWTNNIF